MSPQAPKTGDTESTETGHLPRENETLPSRRSWYDQAARAVIGLATALLIWSIAFSGALLPAFDATVGEIASRDFSAPTDLDVVDVAETENRRAAARQAVNLPYYSDLEAEAEIRTQVGAFFDSATSAALLPLPDFTPSPAPTTATTLPQEEDLPTRPELPQTTVLTGSVYADLDQDGTFTPDLDHPLAGVSLEVVSPDRPRTVITRPDGTFTISIPTDAVLVRLAPAADGLPAGFVPTADSFETQTTCEAASCELPALAAVPHVRPAPDLAALLTTDFDLAPSAAATVADIVLTDILRSAASQPLHLPTLRQVTLSRLNELFDQRITPEDAESIKARQRSNPPVVFMPAASGPDAAASAAAGEILATFFEATYLADLEAYETAQDEAAAAVPDVVRSYTAGELIVSAGSALTPLHIAAITAAETTHAPTMAPLPLAALVGALVGFLGLFIWRIRPDIWASPRLLLLAALLLGLFTATLSLTNRFAPGGEWFMIPAAAFGMMAVVLFDSRTTALLAIAFATITLAMTASGPATGFVLLSTVIPAPLVSAASTRNHFRTATITTAASTAALAAVLAWMFSDAQTDLLPLLGHVLPWAFGVALISVLVGLTALQFLESAFDVTTTLRLLDLTDRNHKALLLLQDTAFGTFNHSLVVGTLAHAAARAIGANPLLARAMAYYHDLGKTASPAHFIENQAGAQNPHDHLDPLESVEILASHVSDGLDLARRFKIPSAVTEGIRSHHGDSIMRYFYGQALATSEAAGAEPPSPDLFRHRGIRPRTREAAILMLADATEAAARATFASATPKDPTPAAVSELVEGIVTEKIFDHQLSDSPLTLSDITKIQEAFVATLSGHYHSRISYPNFPK